MSQLNTGARFEIAIDGTPRSYRDRKELAIKAATFLKTKHPNAQLKVVRPGNGRDDRGEAPAREVRGPKQTTGVLCDLNPDERAAV
jgi:hypothetical protein